MHLSPGARDDIVGLEKRVAALAIAIGAFFLVLMGYIWTMQVFQHTKYQKLADNNRIRLVEMPATRGIITDRNGIILADSTPSYSLAAVPEDMGPDRNAELAALARLLARPPEEALARFGSVNRKTPFRAVPVLANLTFEEVVRFEAEKDLFPGISVLVTPRRYYPFGPMAAHLLGYVGEVSGEQLALGRHPGARMGDLVGQAGIEQAYNEFLRGEDGGRQVEVDAKGREIGLLGINEPTPGRNLALTVDIRLQLALEEALSGRQGAGVVMDVRTGEILAMASHPSFDPNEFSLGVSRARWKELADDPAHPLQNKAIAGVYPPGSTFKVVTSVAGLMEGTLNPTDAITCTGNYTFGRRTFRDWKAGGHGRVEFHRAVVESCDIFFYQAGDRAGIDALSAWGSRLGMGKRMGIDLPGEMGGLLPSQRWKETVRHEPWFPGETLSVAIGQGYVLVTPLQLCGLYQTVARRGTGMRPFLVARVADVDGRLVRATEPAVRTQVDIPEAVWNLLGQALLGVTEEKGGTGWAARVKGVQVAGKTGTAQVVALDPNAPRKKAQDMAEEERDHALFAGFAPFDDPRIAMAVVVEHGGHGGTAAAPIVAKVFARYWGTEAVPDAAAMAAIPPGD